MTGWTLVGLAGVGLAAGTVDSVAGGGGLLTLPTLLAVGLPPQMALGTNKMQSSFGSTTSALTYWRKGASGGRELLPGFGATPVGAALGAWTATQADPAVLRMLLPVVLIVVFCYVLLKPTLGAVERPARMATRPFFVLSGLALGFYDGFIGPGTGAFWTVTLVAGLGLPLLRATGITKAMNATSNLVALTTFALHGAVVVPAGLAMAAGQIVGASIGSRLALRGGARFIRPMFLTVVAATTTKLLFDVFAAR